MKKIRNVFLCFVFLVSFGYADTRNIVPRGPGEGSIGTSAKPWGDGWFDDLHVNGQDITPIQPGYGKELYLTNHYSMPENLNVYNAFGINTSEKDIRFELAPQTNFQTIIIRKFSDLNEVLIIGTTTNVLTYDGQTIILDYWPALSNWYWRTF